jgi:hypothetical protein
LLLPALEFVPELLLLGAKVKLLGFLVELEGFVALSEGGGKGSLVEEP